MVRLYIYFKVGYNIILPNIWTWVFVGLQTIVVEHFTILKILI